MEKLKAFIIKYKWYIAGGAAALIALYLFRGAGGGGGGQAISTSYTTSDGQTANTYSDPTVMLAQLQAQTGLASQTADLQAQLNLAQISKDNNLASLSYERDISLATIDANKWMAQLDNNLQSTLGALSFDAAKYTADLNLQGIQAQGVITQAEMQSNNYIASLQASTNQKIADIQANVINKQTSASKSNAWLGAISNIFSTAVSTYGGSSGKAPTTGLNTPKSYFV